MIKKRYILSLSAWVVISVLGLSCEKEIPPNFRYDGEQYIVVDGILTNENKLQEIRLTRSLSAYNEIPEPVSGAVVSVSDGIYNYLFSEDASGYYFSDIKFSTVINKLYTLHIEFNGKTYSAQARAMPVLNYSSITYVQFNDSLYYFPQAVTQFNPNEAAMYVINADWSFIPPFDTLPSAKTKAKMYFYELKTIDVNEIFSPATQQVFFPEGTQLIYKKYSLSPEHEKFIRSMLLETSLNGGNFDTEEDNVYTNLSNGALGFFGASFVLSDTLIVH